VAGFDRAVASSFFLFNALSSTDMVNIVTTEVIVIFTSIIYVGTSILNIRAGYKLDLELILYCF